VTRSRRRRARWLRDLDAGAWTDLSLVSAITAVLGIRGYLELTGYPTVGGDALHVAHVLWGGLLMLVALVLLLTFVGRRVRPIAAVVGGLGFGTFIDEVGKFLTHDNDYFFQPAVAIIYVVLVLLYLGARALQVRRPSTAEEHMATALRDLDEALADDMDAHERARIVENLDHSGGHPLARVLREHLERIDLVPSDRPRWTRRVRLWALDLYRRTVRSHWFGRGLIVFFLGQLVVKLGYVAALLADAWHGAGSLGDDLPGTVSGWGLATSSALSGVLVAAGVHALVRGRRLDALRRFQASVLVSLLIGQVFQFHLEQWSALTGLAFHLVVFSGLRYAIDHEQDLAAVDIAHPSPEFRIDG